jgi:hypothetical protein
METDIRGTRSGHLFYAVPVAKGLGPKMKHTVTTPMKSRAVKKWCKKCHRNHSRAIACRLMVTKQQAYDENGVKVGSPSLRTMRGFIA